MSIIRQGSLFSLEELFDLEPTQRFEHVFSAIDLDPILLVVAKKSLYGAPVQLNYAAMIYSLVARIMERIPTIKDLIKRLKHDFIFRLDCGFLLSDALTSIFKKKHYEIDSYYECSNIINATLVI